MDTISDLGTAGIISGTITTIVTGLPIGVQTLISLGLPFLGCIYNYQNRIGSEVIEEKKKEQLGKLVNELKGFMSGRGLEDLNRYVKMDFSTEEYAIVEKLVQEGINAKNFWIRKLAAGMIVTIGSSEELDVKGIYRGLKIIEELDDLDIRLLLLHAYITEYRKDTTNVGLHSEAQILKADILSDPSVLSQHIYISSRNLEQLGLVRRKCELYPYEASENKAEMLDNFLSLNREEITPVFIVFQNCIKGII